MRLAGATGATRREVVTMGECLVSLVAADSAPLPDVRALHPHVAGAEANVAVGLARLGHRVAFSGRVGADGFETRIVRALRGEEVDVVGLTVDPNGPTGLMIRERRGVGPSEVIYHRTGSAGARLGPEDVAAAVERGVFGGARWLHLTGITPALSDSCRAAVAVALEASRAEGLTVSFDVNLRRRLWSDAESASVLRDLVARVDVLIADEAEAALVTGLTDAAGPESLAIAIVELGPSLAVMKLGAGGGLAVARGGHRCPGHRIAGRHGGRSGRRGRRVLGRVHCRPPGRRRRADCPGMGECLRCSVSRRRGRHDRTADPPGARATTDQGWVGHAALTADGPRLALRDPQGSGEQASGPSLRPAGPASSPAVEPRNHRSAPVTHIGNASQAPGASSGFGWLTLEAWNSPFRLRRRQ